MRSMGADGFAAAGVVVVGSSLLVALYAIVPLGMLKQFARFSQIDDVDGHGDTQGIRFEDVQRTKGFFMPHYVCDAVSAPDLWLVVLPCCLRDLRSCH